MTEPIKEMMIPDRVSLKTGNGGLQYLELRYNGAEAHLYLHGAHILHYQPAGQFPVLWQSKKSWFEEGKPIRGGIPVCWPWFGPHPENPDQPAHGVARIAEWDLVDAIATDTSTIVTLLLPPDCYPDAHLHLTVELSDSLSVALTTTNTGDTDFMFTEALHSYFSIGNIDDITLSGLEEQQYIDKLKSDTDLQRQDGLISFSSETDRIYTNTAQTCVLADGAHNRTITISKQNSLSTVVWNPWIDKSIRMPDFGDNEYKGMACIETANCGPDCITLPPGKTHSMQLNISAQPDLSESN